MKKPGKASVRSPEATIQANQPPVISSLVASGVVVDLLLAGFYLLRLTGAFEYPWDRLFGICCLAALLAVSSLRCVKECQEGFFPVRLGGSISLAVALLLSMALLVEVATASDPLNSENQSSRMFELL